MKKNFLFPVFLAIATLSCAQNQEIFSKWSIGTSLTYPLQGIYMLQLNYRPTHNHEFFIGPCFQNFGHESFKVNAYTLLIGYRYYIWKGLHVESFIRHIIIFTQRLPRPAFLALKCGRKSR